MHDQLTKVNASVCRRTSLFSSVSRLVTFILPMMWPASRSCFFMWREIWYLSVATVAPQTATSLALVPPVAARARAGVLHPADLEEFLGRAREMGMIFGVTTATYEV